jgi:nitrate reductase molybdenum cofactor assembly chaperone NarJ/NarW
MQIYRILARLLAYPDAELIEALPDIRREIAGATMLPEALRRNLDGLAQELGAADLLDAQERYVGLFDRSRTLSLHLFEHVHGDSRDRGSAMVDLIGVYRDAGFYVTARELPDFLPLFLEFLSLVAPEFARQQLADTVHILDELRRRLENRRSPYAAIFAALLALADAELVATASPPVEEEDDSPAAIDRAWEEAAVTFGPQNPAGSEPGGSGCDRASQWLRRMGIDHSKGGRIRP